MGGITNPAEEYFKDGTWGWDGSAWHKLPMVFGYSDRWAEEVEGVAAGAGDGVALSTQVVEGYIYVLQQVSAHHDAGANKLLFVEVTDGTVYTILFEELTATSDHNYVWTGQIVLKEDDRLRGYVVAPGAGKKVTMRIWGYKMKVAE